MKLLEVQKMHFQRCRNVTLLILILIRLIIIRLIISRLMIEAKRSE